MTQKIQIKDGNGQLQYVFSAPGYDEVDDAVRVKNIQKRVRDAFPGTTLNPLKWDTSLGAGGAASVATGVVTFGSGTTANSESILTLKEMFTIPFRASIGMYLSQRIINQSFYIEAVSVDPVTGIPNGQNSMSWLFEGVTATQAKYTVQSEGMVNLVSSSVTVPNSASVGMLELEAFADEAWFHTGTFDGTAGRAQSYRRHQRCPDPNATYKIRLRWKNGGTAPATNTNAIIMSCAVEDFCEVLAEMVAGRGNVSPGQSMGVTVTNNVPVTVSGTPAVTIFGTPAVTARLAPLASADGFATPGKLISAAGTNATSVRSVATILGLLTVHNVSASVRYLKIYNKASAPTVGTDVPVHTIPIASGAAVLFPIPAAGLRLSTGFALAITAGGADTDTTAVAAGDVLVNWEYN